LGRRTPIGRGLFIYNPGRTYPSKSGYKRTLNYKSNSTRITQVQTSLTVRPNWSDRSASALCKFWLPTVGEELKWADVGVGIDEGRARGDATPTPAHGAGAEDTMGRRAEEDLGEQVVGQISQR